LAFLGIGLYDFFIIHIFSFMWGHFNHTNITVSGRVSGGVVGALIGVVIANGLLEVALVSNPTLMIKGLIILIAILIGAFILGPFMRIIFNSPEMHIWHHSYDLPEDRRNGINFGLTLAVWDYIFGTAYIPHDGRDIRLGFPGVEEFPENFVGQVTHGFNGRSHS